MKRHRLDIALGLLVFAVALALRIWVAAPVFAGDTRFIQGDDDDYYAIAMSLLQHGTFATAGQPTAYRMPFFPIVLAGLHLLTGQQPYAVLPLLLLMGALIPLGTYILGRYLVGPGVGLIAGMLLAFDKDLIIYSRLYMTETLFGLLVLASMLAAWRLRATMSWRWTIAAGLLLGCASMTRANFLPFVALLLLWLLWLGRDRLGLALRSAALIGAIVGAMWLPWVARNYLVFHQLIPFTTQAGDAYYGIYNDLSVSGRPGTLFGYWAELDAAPPQAQGQVWDEVTLDLYRRDQARQWIAAHPAAALKAALAQVGYLWSFEDFGSYLRVTAVGLPALIVLALRRRHPDLLLWLVLTLALSFLAIISVGVARYAFPLRPILAVATAIVLSGAARLLAERRRPGAQVEGVA